MMRTFSITEFFSLRDQAKFGYHGRAGTVEHINQIPEELFTPGGVVEFCIVAWNSGVALA